MPTKTSLKNSIKKVADRIATKHDLDIKVYVGYEYGSTVITMDVREGRNSLEKYYFLPNNHKASAWEKRTFGGTKLTEMVKLFLVKFEKDLIGFKKK